MSLTDPTIIDRLKAWPYWKVTAVGVGLLILIGFVAFTVDRCGKSRDQKDTDEKKAAINANVAEIGNITNQITNLEVRREGLKEGVNRDMQDLQKDIYGREEAKREANQALANFQRAIDSNSNVNRSAEDLERVLRNLDGDR